MNKTDAELLEQAQSLYAEAQALLLQDGLLTVIQRFGPTFISGSAALNLMVRRDIDIYVRLPHDLDVATFFAIGAAITHQFQVFKASYSNHFIRNFPGFDHGLYWGIRLGCQGQRWKLDLWGHGAGHFDEHCAQLEQLQEALKTVDQVTVLRIKDAFRDGDGYRDGVTGYNIYTAVLTANVRTAEQFGE